MKRSAESADLGKIEFYAYLKNPRGPSLIRKKIILTVVSKEDDEILAAKGVAPLRQARLLRFCGEANEQEALLAYEDLTILLLTSLSTIKRDLCSLRKRGLSAPVHRKKQRAVKEPDARSNGS